MSKYFTGVMQVILGKKRFLVRFQNGCENNLSSNQLTIVIEEKIPEENKTEVFKNPEIPEEQITLDQGYYRYVYVIIWFKKEVGVDIKEE